MIPIVKVELCTGCGACREICPPNAIDITDGAAVVEKEFCEECGLCASQCPVEAIIIPFPCGS
jgi:heterodisulfide reductase subunit A-like polyferredoxin